MTSPLREVQKTGEVLASTRGSETGPFYFIKDVKGVFELDAIVSLFSNLAVPVACLIATFYLWNKEREDHKQEQKELTEAIANNTLVMQKLVDKLDKDQ